MENLLEFLPSHHVPGKGISAATPVKEVGEAKAEIYDLPTPPAAEMPAAARPACVTCGKLPTEKKQIIARRNKGGLATNIIVIGINAVFVRRSEMHATNFPSPLQDRDRR